VIIINKNSPFLKEVEVNKAFEIKALNVKSAGFMHG